VPGRWQTILFDSATFCGYIATYAARAWVTVFLLGKNIENKDLDMGSLISVFYRLWLWGMLGVAALLPIPRFLPAQPTAAPLLQQSDLHYQGAFRVPGNVAGSTFAYGGTALAYHPAHSSLFLVGHDWDQKVAEIDVPQITQSSQISALATAPVLQSFVEASEGKMFTVDSGTVKVGGLLVSGGKLYGTAYSYYDADGSQSRSHYRTALSLSQPGDVQGMYQVGTLGAGVVAGYMTTVPPEWQSLLGGPALTGQCCIPIISRSSYGPAAFVFDPNALGAQNPVTVLPLVYYPASHPLSGWSATSSTFNGTTEITGLVFPHGTRSVLFFGRHGTGTFCYGTGQECNDPVESSKGNHAYPYVYQVWAYDAATLLQVKSGQRQPWDVRPYAVWNFTLPFPEATKHLGGAAYDPQSRRIFLSQRCAESGCIPVIHVFTVNTVAAENAPPAAPTNLRVQ
jgi:hypothetical protein